MARFLITGLPRSRTAWWAVATGALHEPISRQGWDVFRTKWQNETGISDSAALLYLGDIIAECGPKTLIVHRDPDDVTESFCRYSGVSDRIAVRRLVAAFQREINFIHPLVMHVSYSDLSDGTLVAECFRFIGVAPPKMLGQLMHMRIESDLGWNLAELLKRKAS